MSCLGPTPDLNVAARNAGDGYRSRLIVKTWRSPKIKVTENTLAGRGVVAIDDIVRDEIVAIKARQIR
jgi:hypothetical protein